MLGAWFALAVAPGPAAALETIELGVGTERYDLARHLELLEDRQGRLTIDDVARPSRQGWSATDGSRPPNFGITRSVYWARFRIGEDGPRVERLLEFASPITDSVELYIPVGVTDEPGGPERDGGFHVVRAGEAFPFDTRDVPHRNPTFRLPASDAPQTYYVRISGNDTIRIPLVLWSARAFESHRASDGYRLGTLFGVLIVFALYNVLLHWATRDTIYLYYLAAVVSFSLYWMAFTGLIAQFVLPGSPRGVLLALHVGGPLLLASCMMFSRQFLATATNVPRTDVMFRAILALFVIMIVWPFFGDLIVLQRVLIIPSLVGAVALIATAFHELRRGYRPALFFLIGWIWLLSVAFAYGLEGFGWYVLALQASSLLPVAFLATLFSLTLGLMQRFRWLEREARAATELRARQQQELAHALRLSTMGELSSTLAHELNQPLSAIVNYARACIRLVEANEVDMAVVRQGLEQVSAEALRGGDIVRALLQFTRKHVRKDEPLDLREVLEDALSLSALEPRAQNIRVSLYADADLPAVLADRVLLQQVFMNLTRNAFEAMDEQAYDDRSLSIEACRTRDGGIDVTFTDSGHGIGEELRSRIFESFVTTKERGLGMGLAISKSIVEDHGGELQITSNGNGGNGTTVRVSLPLHAAAA